MIPYFHVYNLGMYFPLCTRYVSLGEVFVTLDISPRLQNQKVHRTKDYKEFN